ncbi:MAG: hypothetical protein KGN84_10340 [Acidobacteriota bacterium]|nr:hypothetical protein [Acidobacteriota bacterium]
MRPGSVALLALALAGCGGSAPKEAPPVEKKSAEPVKITHLYPSQAILPKGTSGTLCYGVENATKVELTPPVDEVWPAFTRCIAIAPKVKTTYTLTAYGANGSRDSKSVDVIVGAPPPRLYDLSVNKIEVAAGEQVTVCFKLENVKEVKASPGRLDRQYNCIFDNPKKTTTYRIEAIGGDGQEDSGSVTVKVK